MSATSATDTPPIVLKDLNHWFGLGESRFKALHDISLEIERGKLTILMGPSGSGKTTLLTIMGCLRETQDGSARLLGTELNGASDRLKTHLRRRLGFIFQAHNLHESLTALQNVRMGLDVHGQGDSKMYDQAAAHMLGLVGLADRIQHLPANLSGGQKQRVAIARALVGNPDVVFADEPTAALDKESGVSVVKMLKRLAKERNTTTLMVTHDNRILELADRIITLEDGRLVGDQRNSA